MWRDRVAQVRASGTASLVTATAERWFGPGFLEREPERASALLHALRDAADDGYVAVCGALAAYDVRDRLGEIAAPVVAVAGAHDPVCPPEPARARSPTACSTAGSSSSTASPTRRRPRRPSEVAGIIRELGRRRCA